MMGNILRPGDGDGPSRLHRRSHGIGFGFCIRHPAYIGVRHLSITPILLERLTGLEPAHICLEGRGPTIRRQPRITAGECVHLPEKEKMKGIGFVLYTAQWVRESDSNQRPAAHGAAELPTALSRSIGDPNGSRTRVTAVKGRCLSHLTTGPNLLVVYYMQNR